MFFIFSGVNSSYHRRPDSSSSASSITDWEGSGHSTVLRRGPVIPVVPALPAPPTNPPLPPSDDKVEPEPEKTPTASTPATRTLKIPRSVPVPEFNFPAMPRMKGLKDKKNRINVLDRLSVRTEFSATRPLNVGSDEGVSTSGKGLYYFPADEESELSATTDKFDASKKGKETSGSIKDQILATQLRLLSRELTPTISDVYHERNIGLGLAPPLSKLLIANQPNYSKPCLDENDFVQCLDKVILDETKRIEEKKPWLTKSTLNLHASEDVGALFPDPKRGSSPCSDLSRRDEGDGRSLADSQCSASSFKKLAPLKGEAEGLYFEPVGVDDAVKELVQPPVPRARASKPPPPPVPSNRNKIGQN